MRHKNYHHKILWSLTMYTETKCGWSEWKEEALEKSIVAAVMCENHLCFCSIIVSYKSTAICLYAHTQTHSKKQSTTTFSTIHFYRHCVFLYTSAHCLCIYWHGCCSCLVQDKKCFYKHFISCCYWFDAPKWNRFLFRKFFVGKFLPIWMHFEHVSMTLSNVFVQRQ